MSKSVQVFQKIDVSFPAGVDEMAQLFESFGFINPSTNQPATTEDISARLQHFMREGSKRVETASAHTFVDDEMNIKDEHDTDPGHEYADRDELRFK